MGTRGLTAVQVDGKYVVAQYGQWDHYPSGQGVTALKFCQQHLKSKNGREKFKAKLQQVEFSKDDDALNACTFEREKDDYSNVFTKTANPDDIGKVEIAKKKEQYPYAGRDNGANILNLIWDAPPDKKILLVDQIKFVGDSLFCEFAYVIDLDASTLEVFKGFNKRPLGQKQRFKDYFEKVEHRNQEQYQPISHLKTYDLDNLPTKSVFLEELEPKEE